MESTAATSFGFAWVLLEAPDNVLLLIVSASTAGGPGLDLGPDFAGKSDEGFFNIDGILG